MRVTDHMCECVGMFVCKCVGMFVCVCVWGGGVCYVGWSGEFHVMTIMRSGFG